MVGDDGSSSSVSLSPLQLFSFLSISGSPYPWLRELTSEDRGLCLIQLLISCVTHVSTGSLGHTNLCLEQISVHASPEGDSMQRMAAYFAEALADRFLKCLPGFHRAYNSTRISNVSEEMLVRRLFFDLCPFLKLSFVISNQAIMEAIEGEKMVHIIDLNSAESAQWIALFQALRMRPDGPPHLRITAIHEHRQVLEQTALRLTEEAEKLDIPFQFNPVVCKLENLEVDALRIKTGEALAISSIFQLHSLLAAPDEEGIQKTTPTTPSSSVTSRTSINHMQKILNRNQSTLGELMKNDCLMSSGNDPSPDSAASSSPPSSAVKMESFLASLWGLSPKVMVIAEQESNHNDSTLMERLLQALHFYGSLFDCLESTVSRGSMDRMKLEKMMFGEEIKNIISCEGVDRKERHERLDKWVQRLDYSGFGRVSLSYYALLQGRRLLQSYGCDGYGIKEENGAFVICWQGQALFTVTAWRCKRFD